MSANITREKITNLSVSELHLGDVVKNNNVRDYGFNWMTLVKIADNGTGGKSYHFKRPFIHINDVSYYIGMEDAVYYDWNTNLSFDLAPDRTSIPVLR